MQIILIISLPSIGTYQFGHAHLCISKFNHRSKYENKIKIYHHLELHWFSEISIFNNILSSIEFLVYQEYPHEKNFLICHNNFLQLENNGPCFFTYI